MEAAKTILALGTNNTYLMHIREAAGTVGAVVAEVFAEADTIEKIQTIHPSLLILDLSHRPAGWEHVVQTAREHRVPVIAFGPHVDQTGQDAAREAGCDEVVAKSKFQMELPNLMSKYL